MDVEGLHEMLLRLEKRVVSLEEAAMIKNALRLDELVVGNIYRIHYKMRGQRNPRYAQLVWAGITSGPRNDRLDFYGKPGIGNISFFKDEINWIAPVPEGTAKATWFDKSQPVT